MADKRGLEIVGAAFGLVTATVVMIAAMVVKIHVDTQATMNTTTTTAEQPVVSALVLPVIR